MNRYHAFDWSCGGAAAIPVVVPASTDLWMPGKGDIWYRHDAVAEGQQKAYMPLSRTVRGQDDAYTVWNTQVEAVLWIPRSETILQARLVVSAHMLGAGHWSVKVRRGGTCEVLSALCGRQSENILLCYLVDVV